MSTDIFPWHIKQWEQLWSLHQQKQLPHALLFSGIAGIGKLHFSQMLAHSLLCLTPLSNGVACTKCRSCHLTKAGTHPDLLNVAPEEQGQIIKVDQIRDVVTFVNESAQQGGYRVIIINPANAMNINASNSLLKTLEEPTSNILFILITNQSGRLSATIKSRCQEYAFAKPTQDSALAWLNEKIKNKNQDSQLLLNLANGAPLKSLELLENNFLEMRHDLYKGLNELSLNKKDPLLLATHFQDLNLLVFFDLLQNGLHDLLRLKLTEEKRMLINTDCEELFLSMGSRFTLKNLMNYIDIVQNTYSKVIRSLNLNRQLLLEELFIQWVKHASC